MPKERIKHGQRYAEIPHEGGGISVEPVGPEGLPYRPEPPGTVYSEDPSLDVTWSRDNGHVQLSIDFTRDMWLTNAEYVASDETITHRAIYTDSLTRQEINRLIRTLRRARDAAYGADE